MYCVFTLNYTINNLIGTLYYIFVLFDSKKLFNENNSKKTKISGNLSWP